MSTQKYSVTPHQIDTLLSWVKSGEIAIPEIQRPFVWEPVKVRNLLDSLYAGFPVGYLITWRNPTVRLKDGTYSAGKRILIDGQQRVTALMAALLGRDVLTKDYETTRITIAFNPIEEKFEVANSSDREECRVDKRRQFHVRRGRRFSGYRRRLRDREPERGPQAGRQDPSAPDEDHGQQRRRDRIGRGPRHRDGDGDLHSLKSSACRAELRTCAKGIVEGFWRLYTDDFYDIRVPVPPLEEQRLIVQFLDWDGAQTTKLIRAKKKLVALLNEQKQAIIRRAVTRGIDPNVTLVPSGFDWLGDVPKGWTVRKLRHCGTIVGGVTPSMDEPKYWDGDIPWITPKDMKRRVLADSHNAANS